MMEQTNYENLQIYQLAEKLSNEVWDAVIFWDYFAKDTVGKQLVRAADSVAANIAEGNGCGSEVDNRKFLRQARGSLYETKSFLRLAYRRKLLTDDQMQIFKPLINELIPKLNAYISRVTVSIQDQKSKPKDQM
jgi:four helix bundle protein